MSTRRFIWISLCLLCLAGAWFLRHHLVTLRMEPPAVATAAAAPQPAAILPTSTTVRSASTAPNILTVVSTNTAATKTNRFAYRLSNTSKTIGQLTANQQAILLENALIDTGSPLNLSIPKNLKSKGDPGAYIVQARGPIDNAFRVLLASAGATIVSYIPNDAYLVRVGQGGANVLAAQSPVQTVLPYEPYYKIQSSLLALAMNDKPLPDGMMLTLGLFPGDTQPAVQQVEKLGGQVTAQETSPFGPILRVQMPASQSADWTVVATWPAVKTVEAYHERVHANDLSRATVGVAVDTQTNINYLNLSGSNVLVELNDSGVDATHPDFQTGSGLPVRVFGDSINLLANTLVDTDGHGTHVAGIIAGNGLMSSWVTNAPGSITPATNGQFRGMAPLAKLLAMNFGDLDGDLQAAAAQTNALISNNSWNYADNSYNLAAASYDAAVRDALPLVTGSQPVLFVFSAGNDGGGNTDGSGGDPDTIMSPGTAKNVITVGALEQSRGITNWVTAHDGTSNQIWLNLTDTGYPQGNYQVANYSARGNVGVGEEGTFGRIKPDVVAPGTFVISTRSAQWDEHAYYNPTNFYFHTYENQTAVPLQLNRYTLSVPINAVGVYIFIFQNQFSPSPFPNLPIYVRKADYPTTNSPGGFDFVVWTNEVSIPPNSGPAITSIQSIQNLGFFFAVGNTNPLPVNYNMTTEVVTTNDLGNYYTVLSNLNNSLGGDPNSLVPPHWYRYETGTSMSAADVSGVLALMQDFFTNTLHTTPSPALLKALLINGARSLGNYDFFTGTALNYQGWGLINLPTSVPAGATNPAAGANSVFFVDQSSTNGLATGDQHTYQVTLPDGSDGQFLPLQVTLTWTDPPGDPAAAIKLVNNLDLVVSNLDDPANPVIFYGNDIGTGTTFNTPEGTNAPVLDAVNNVENVFISPLLGTNYTVTVVGRNVNVNAVTAHTNNVVQDFALVITSGNGEVTNAFTVADLGTTYAPTSDQQLTTVLSTNAPLFNQFAGASTPLLGTNSMQVTTNGTQLNGLQITSTNVMFTVGMTNQWHFYVVTNDGGSDFTNAAFITFLPSTLSIPRMGVFADNLANATRPEADIDLYVSANPALTNLDPVVVSNADKSVGRGGTEFVAYSNSAPGKVYYIGIYSQAQEASEYDFIPIFTDIPFTQPGPNGSQIVNGLNVPVNIPDGSTVHPGISYTFALAMDPMLVKRVVLTNLITHQNFGDLIGTLAHGNQTGASQSIVVNNHDGLGNTFGTLPLVYDDSGEGDIPSARTTDGPGSLNNFVGQPAIGPWILTEVDDSLTQTGMVQSLSMLIEPHQDLTKGIFATLGPLGWFYEYIDVPAWATNLSIFATNITASGQVDLFVKYGALPTLTDTNEIGPVGLTNGTPPGNSISIGPPLRPGRYYIGLNNESILPQTVYILAQLGLGHSPVPVNFTSGSAMPIPDDAVSYATNFVSNAGPISSVDVGLRVDHPRISDMVFHLISPRGTRCLLVENRGGLDTNGMGQTLGFTNLQPMTISGNEQPTTNTFDVLQTSGTLAIDYNFYQVPDEMLVFAGATLIFDSGLISGSGVFNIPYSGTSIITIVMNPNNGVVGTGWDYTLETGQMPNTYLVLTEDTNKTTTPIKYAPTPFHGTPTITMTTNTVPVTNVVVTFTTNIIPASVISNSFEGAAAGSYTPASGLFDSWTVNNNQVTVITDPTLAYAGNNLLALADGVISNTISAVSNQICTVTYAYRGPGAVGLWRGQNTANDDINGNNGTPTSMSYAIGEVGRAFVFDGTSSFVKVPANSVLDVGQYNGFTLDTWANPVTTNSALSNPMTLMEWNNDSGALSGIGCHLEFYNGGEILGDIVDPSGTDHSVFTPGGNVEPGVYQHVVMSYNKITGLLSLYRNGVLVTSGSIGNWTPTSGFNLYFGTRPAGVFTGSLFQGQLDEVSVYNRVLSDSEIQAIYNHGHAGKYNSLSAPTLSQGLAEARLTVGSLTLPSFFGTNMYWQTGSYTFTANATQTNTLLMTGLEPGMLLDDIVVNLSAVTNIVASATTNITFQTNVTSTATGGDVYYLPEQTLDVYAGESSAGPWTLEMWDNRVGAGATNTLVSWQLRFNYATNPPVFPVIGGPGSTNAPVTNTIPTGSIQYYLINVPTNADWATNTLFNTTGPLNLLFNLTNPPTGTGLNDYTLLSAVFPAGTNVLGTNTATPPFMVPGGTYYLGVQNLGAGSVTYSLEVNFHLVFPAPPPVLPTQPDQTILAGTTTTVNNAALSGTPVLTYSLVSPPPWATINPASGLITLAPTLAEAPTNAVITTIVTDGNLPVLSATNSFNVVVVTTNGLPAFPGAEGAGGFAIGGRGGDVYHVINLLDSGPGSLRFGVQTATGSRTIVFDVSGTINLFSNLKINRPYLTIAGQTAPGDGVAVKGLLTSVQNTHDDQVRFLRFRPGDINCPFFQDDAFHFVFVTNSIVDHVSASWSIDEALSTTESTNITVQWSMIAEALNNSCHVKGLHGYGSLIRYGYGAISYHHNLYADNFSRNPRPGDNTRLDYINNVIFNWGIKAGYNEDDTDPTINPAGYTNFLNYIGNYLIAGTNTTSNINIAFQSGVPDPTFTQIFQSGNLIDSNPLGVLNGINTGPAMFSGLYTTLASQLVLPEIPVTITNAPQAYEQVLDFAGASVAGASILGTSLTRDTVDTNIVTGVRYKNGFIVDTEAQVGGWPALHPAPLPTDTDQDGMPDYWEITLAAVGFPSMNPSVANNNHPNPDGYTDLEHYINWLAAPHALTITNKPVDVNLYAMAGGSGNLAFSVANGTNGTVILTNDYNGHAIFTPSNNYFGFASFGFNVTNLDTSVVVAPETVSVMVSKIAIPTNSGPLVIITLTNKIPYFQTNSIGTNGLDYYRFFVSPAAAGVRFDVTNMSSDVNLFARFGLLPSTGSFDYSSVNPGTANETITVLPSSLPVPLTSGWWYLAVSTVSGPPATYAILATELDYPAPFAFTEPATLVTGTNAQLNGMATPNGLPTTAWFQWGSTTNYVSFTAPVNVGSSTNVVYTTNQITGLVTNVPYHFRLVVSNAAAVVYGFDQILDEANVVAWGADFVGQGNVPVGLSNVVAIAGAYDHSLALKQNSTVVAWGDNTFGQATVPAGLNNPVAVAGGEYYSMVLQNNGIVTAWGADIFPGQTNVPAGLGNVVEIAGGTYSSLALQSNGVVVAWGANFSGQTNVPVGLSNVVAIAAGSLHGLAAKNDGTVVAWGDNGYGQTNVPAGLSNVVAIAAGSLHSLALKYDGTVVAWGANFSGQTNVPSGLSNVVAVAAGGFHSLALKNDGSVVAWGDSSAGQTNVPVGLNNVVAIAGGNLHSLALTSFYNVNPTNPIIFSIVDGVPQTATVGAGGILYYQVNVPGNADLATNILSALNPNQKLNLWFSTNPPPALTTLLLGGVTNGVSVLSTNSAPTNIVAGATYYLGVQNTNSFSVTYTIEVDFHLLAVVPPPPVGISSIVFTNGGFLLTWFAPSNDLFMVQWTDSFTPTNWGTFTNIISYNTNFPASATNAQFNFFDDGSQSGGFSPMRFYRLLLLQATNSLTLPLQTNFTVGAAAVVTVTNVAVDSRTGAVLTYYLTNSPVGATITNGVINWTAAPAGLAARFNTVVTDDSIPPLTATNTFTIFVAPLPSITNVVVTATNLVLQWSAPTNDQFQVEWTTNLAPPSWSLFPNVITSSNGLFSFTDTNAPLIMVFYRLMLLP